jgi:hypothetical protein
MPTSLNFLSGLHGAIAKTLRLQLRSAAALAFGFGFARLLQTSLLAIAITVGCLCEPWQPPDRQPA